jgi:hypothetical protein
MFREEGGDSIRPEPGCQASFVLSVVKATSFWFTFVTILTMEKWMLVVGLAAVTFFAGPAWHLWISRIIMWRVGERAHAG